MRRLAEIFVFAATAALVLSCASTTQQRASPTAPPSGPASQGRGQDSPVEDSLPPGSAAQGVQNEPADVSLGIPAAPQARAAPEAEPSLPQSSPESEKFPLTTPLPPPIAGGKGADVAARPNETQEPATRTQKPQGAVPRQAASAQQQPAPSRPQGRAAQPQSSASQNAAKPSAVPAQAAPQPQVGSSQAAASSDAQSSTPSTYGKLREIYAREGDDVQIGLDGVGFLFLGFPDRSPNGDGMSFKGKDTRDGKTWFGFKALKLGTYDLDFLRQDNTTGTSSKETVRVHVVSDADFSAAVAQGQQTPASTEAAGDPAFAAKLASLGQYDAAISELLKGYREGNPGLNDSIAQLYLRSGAYDAAAKYFTKNLAEQGRYGDGAVLGLTKVAIAQKDQPELLSLLKKLLAVKDPGLEETLVAVARFEGEKQEVGLGIDLADEYLTRYPDGKWRDEADFILGQLLELDSQFRDLARARATYREILARFPESLFAARARERVEYIDRHFFEIR